MAAPYSGIRRFLKDPDASWSDKLKLVRYSWVNGSCYFPNKYQVLVDWCCQALFANERNHIPQPDVANLWSFLKDAFLSEQFEKIGESIMIPTVFYSALSNTLQRKPPYIQDVLLVTKLIFRRPHLCESLLAKVDISIKLLSCLLHLVRNDVNTEDINEETAGLTLLLQNVLQAFSYKYKFRLIQKKVFEDISKEALVHCLCIHKELPVLQSDIEQFISQTIFSKDLLSAYTDFLRKNAPPSEKAQRQYVSVAMETLEETLKNSDENDEMESVIKAIPLLFGLFVTSLRPKVDISFSMLKNLLRLLGFLEAKESWEGSDDLRSSAVDSVSLLISAIIQHEVYKVTDDEAENGKKKVYLKHLTSQVISLNQWSQPSWFRSLRLLFSLDHKLMESHQVVALKAVLRKATDESQRLEESKLEFFCEVSDTYLKLRQFPKFCEFLMKCCSLEPQDESLKFPSRILEHLGKIIQQLPQQTSLGIWTSLKNALTDSMTEFSKRLEDELILQPPLKKKKKRIEETEVKVSDSLEGLAVLFGCVIRNCRVVEYSMVPQGSDALNVLLQEITRDILAPSLSTLAEIDMEEYVEDLDSLLFAVLHVACCYGDVQLLLLNYTSRESSLKDGGRLKEALKDKEFHQFHSYVSQDIWQRVLRISEQSGDSRILFLQNSLSVQQIRSLVLTDRDISEVTKKSLQNLTSGLFSADYTRADIPSSATKLSHQSAGHVQLLINIYPIIKPYMSETDKLNFATLISRLIFVREDRNECAREYSEVNSGVSAHKLAVRFSESDLFMEARDLHGHLVTKAVEMFSSAMTLRASPDAKVSSYIPDLLTILDNPEKLIRVVKELTGGQTTGLLDSQIQLIKVFTKLISALPMGLLSSKNQTNSLLALTFIDFLLTKATVIPIYDQLVCLAGVRKLAGDFVKEIRKSDVLSTIDVKAVIVELAMSHVRLSEKVLAHHSNESKVVLLDITQDTSDLISHWLRRERVWTKGSGSIKRLIKKVMSLIQGFIDEESQQNIVGQRSSVIDLTSVIIRYCDRYNETVPSNFTDYSLSFCEILNKLIVDIEYSSCSPDVFYIVSSISNFFLNLKECHELTKDGGKLCQLKESQSAWLKSVLPWLPKWKLPNTHEGSSKLLQAATDKCLRLASTMNEDKLRDSWSSLHLLLGQQEGQMSADMQMILKVAIPLMTDTVFEQCLKESISTLRVGGDSVSVIAGLQLWQAIPFTELEETKLVIIANLVPDLISKSVHLLQEISLVAELDDKMASLLFSCLAYVISQGKDFLTEETAVSSLSLCLLLPLELLSGAHFPSVFRAACTLVNNIMLAFPQSLLRSSHSFLTCLQYLLKHAMNRGQQTPDRDVSDELLIACAEDMERLLTLYASHKETKQIGCFLVATFFQEVQRATLLPAFKKILIIGIYNLVDSSDFKNLSLVQRTMPTELQEVYKSFMSDYYKYHRFKGNV